MAQGLDELVEWLVGEVSFYGDGCPLPEFIAAVVRFQENDQDRRKDATSDNGDLVPGDVPTKSPPTEAQLKLARLAWKWLLSTGEVSIGPEGEWNHLTFDEITSLPEDVGQAAAPPRDAPKHKRLPRVRPRIFVGEETVWKTLTGHSIDYKRVPNLEWKCLVAIGSTKEDGILQGDLNRATGQDKRSVPKRTDFLAQKGYIAKRTHMVRGMKTSKLWLTKFAPALPVPSNPLGGKDLSRASLTRDMQPVAWHQQWTGKDKEGRPEIHYMALGQTIIAITKAWGTLRIRDLKAKLGILGKRWQMKVMSRFLRRFHKLGNVTYVAATFAGDKHVFKDCVRFARDPTESDWRLLLATGKKTSRYTNQGKDKQPRARSKPKGGKGRVKKASYPAQPTVKVLRKKPKLMLGARMTGWAPEKPLANIVADFVLTGGARGYSTPEISTYTVGYVFRRHMFTHLINLSNGDVQPAGLREYQMSKVLVKLGNTKQYMFSVAGGRKAKPSDEQEEQTAIDPALRQGADGMEQSAANQTIEDAFGFGSVDPKVFDVDGSSYLTQLSGMEHGKQIKTRRPNGSRQSKVHVAIKGTQSTKAAEHLGAEQLGVEQGDEANTIATAPRRRRGRPPKVKIQSNGDEAEEIPSSRPSRKRRASQPASYLESPNLDNEDSEMVAEASALKEQPRPKRRAAMKAPISQDHENATPEDEHEDEPEEEEEEEEEQDRSKPGIYIGIPGSLNPEPKKKGRPRKSLVVIFRSDKLKDPNYLPGWTDYPKPITASHDSDIHHAPRKTPSRPPLSVDVGATGLYQTDSIEKKADQVCDAVILPREPAVASSQNQKSMEEAAEDDEGTIVVQSLGSGNTSQDGQEEQEEQYNDAAVHDTSPTAVEPFSTDKLDTEAGHAPAKAERQPRKPRLDKYVCEKCGGTWKNDIGLKYHLEKAKVPCNPFYAENPELMVKAKPVRTSRPRARTPEPQDEAASPGSSVKSGLSVSPSPRTPRSARVPRKKKPLAPKTVDQCDPANQRTILKQRSAFRNSQFGLSGVSTPRGLRVSEAVAKDAADTTKTATQEAIAEPSAAELVISDHTKSKDPDDVELDEDLPYLAHLRARDTKLQPRLSASGFRKLEPRNQERQRSIDMAQKIPGVQAMEPVPSLDPTSNLGPANASALHEPYPLEVLEQTTQGATSGNMFFPAQSQGAALPFAYMSPSSTQISTRARKPLPVQRPAVPVETDLAPLREDWQQGGALQGQLPPFRLPMTDFKARTANEVRSHKIEEIIRYLLANNGGVFPSGRALFYAILKIYIREWPGLPLPTTVGVTRVINRLQEQQEIKEMSSAYKSPTERLWTTLVMLTLSHIDPNGPVAGDLKKKMKAAQPDVYIPAHFAPDETEKAHFKKLDILPAQRGKGPGRRDHKLEEEIVTFDAPFYLQKGLAGVRPRTRPRAVQSEDEESNAGDGESEGTETALLPRRRGRKRAAEGQFSETPAVKKTRRGRKPRNMISFDAADDDETPAPWSIMPHQFSIDESHATNPGLGSLPASFFSGTASAPASSYTAPSKVQFLEPNTRLEEEGEPDLEPQDIEETPSNEPANDQRGYFLHTVMEGSFTNTIELESTSHGVWPGIHIQWFEANDSSFTMKGWFPQAREVLKEHLPKTMEQMAYKITSHCKTEKWADPAYGQFVTSVDGCMSWELSDQGYRSMSGTIAPDYVFICFAPSLAVSNMAPCTLQWNDNNNWTLESIPYEKLVVDEEEAAKSAETAEPYGIIPFAERGVRRGPGRPRKYPLSVGDGPPRKYARKQPKDERVRELKLQRELTAYPRESNEYFRQKGQEDPGVDWKAEDTRIAAYVAVSTLLGGINKAMDWGIMMRIFPDSKLSNLRKFWATIKKEREGFIQNLTAKFQEDFLEAYENGDLSPIDFNKPLEYDWLSLIKWTLALVVREGIDLPPNMPQFDEELELVPVERGEFDWRDSYYHWQRSVFNKFQDAAAEPASMVLERQEKEEDADSTIARSWVRALCCTDSDKYTPFSIKKKFLALTRGGQRTEQEISDLLEQTIRDLEHRRIAIKQKSPALAKGRPYRLNEHFLRTLDRFSNEDKFTVAAAFKLKMDEAFRKGKPVEIPWRTEDGMVIAAFNLQAYGRVRIEPIKKLHVPFGFKPGFYESRKFPKSYYRFDLQVTPTSRYIYNEDIEILRRATDDSVIPGATEDGKLPMWCDFFGEPDRTYWFKILSAVLFVLATRGAMTDEFAAQALRPCVETFEVEIIREWALKMGVVREITEGCGAVSVSEWWWLICGLPVTEESESKADGHDQYSSWHKRRWRGQYRVH